MDGAGVWSDACLAAALAATAGPALGGVRVRAAAGPVRDRWLARLALMAPVPPTRLPAGLTEDRLEDALDLPATLRAGRAVLRAGVLARAAGGLLLLPMAERVEAGAAARLGRALDEAQAGVIALDEGGPDEAPPLALTDRLALQIDLGAVTLRDAAELPVHDVADVAAARARLAGTAVDVEVVRGLTEAAVRLGIGSLRAAVLAVATARAAAALAGRPAAGPEEAAIAARLVLAPRATRLPAPEEPEPEEPEPDDAEPEETPDPPGERDATADGDMLVEAALAALPPGALAALAGAAGPRRRSGTAGAAARAPARGRRIGNRRGRPGAGSPLDLVGTLSAAAPWQPVRRREAPAAAGRIQVRADDFRLHRLKARSETAVVFVVDASGSVALARLGEAKGAVELMLADAYVRREQVALVAFRGAAAEVLLPPTRAPARARRELARLPGGKGTPLAAGLAAGAALAEQLARRGIEPRLVILTDGAGNVALDGTPGRPAAAADAERLARAIRAAGWAAVLIDTARRPQPQSAELAATMGARYLALPFADARELSRAARA